MIDFDPWEAIPQLDGTYNIVSAATQAKMGTAPNKEVAELKIKQHHNFLESAAVFLPYLPLIGNSNSATAENIRKSFITILSLLKTVLPADNIMDSLEEDMRRLFVHIWAELSVHGETA